MGVHACTLIEWKKKFSELSEAIKKGRAPATVEVEDALYKSATGYYVTVKEPVKVKVKKQLANKGTIEEEHIEYVDKQVYIPPNTTAQIFYLKNRDSRRWRDKVDIKPEEDMNAPIKDLLRRLDDECV